MAKDQANARAYGDIGGQVVVGATSATAPTDVDTPWGSPAFADLGWITDQGITEGHSVTTTQKFAWQGATIIRTVKSQDTRTFKFQAYEENATVNGLLRPGAAVSTSGGITTSRVKTFTGQDFRIFGIDMQDGDVAKRFVIPQGEADSSADVVYQAADLTIYEFTVTCYPQSDGTLYIEYSNNPAVAVS